MASLCKPETIPTDFANVLQIYTKQGLRVIAAATKSLNANARWREVDEMSRSELEEKCEFLGFDVILTLSDNSVVLQDDVSNKSNIVIFYEIYVYFRCFKFLGK